MTDVFVICNQQGHFWGKRKMWVDGSDPKALMRVKNRDEATNTLFELSSKDFELRGDIIEVELNDKGEPIVQVSDIPLPSLPEDEEEAEPGTESGDLPEEQASHTTEPKSEQEHQDEAARAENSEDPSSLNH
ncbi:MAG: heat-shock protein HtpX [Halioglobus sp.]